MKLQVREAGEDIKALMEPKQNKEAWKRLTYWYRQASGGQSQPSREHMDSIATDLAEFYRCRPFEELRVPILVTPEAVEDRILGE